MPGTIEITVSPTGDVKVQTKGFAGRSCLDASRDIEQALGDQVGQVRRTGEYCQTEIKNQQHERTDQ